MESFPLNRLPYSLKNTIFEHLSTRDLLKSLEINRELRHYVLKNGPFQRRIQTMDIYIKEAEGDGQSGEEIIVKSFKILLATDDSFRINFVLDRTSNCSVEGEDVNSEVCFKMSSPVLGRFVRLIFCPRLSVSLNQFALEDGENHFRVPLLQLMPRLTGRYLQWLHLSFDESHLAIAFLESFEPSVCSRFLYCGNYADPVLEESREDLENPVFHRFFQKSLLNCAKIELHTTRLEISPLFTDPNLPKTKAELIEIRSILLSDFQRSIESVLKDGIPSQHRYAEFQTRYDHESDQLDSAVLGLKRDLILVANQVDDPIDQGEISSKFPESSSFLNQLLDLEDLDLTFYRRQFSQTTQYFYVLFVFEETIYFLALTEPFHGF